MVVEKDKQYSKVQIPVDDFCKWLISNQHTDVTVTAHNSRAYDAYFIYDYPMRNSIIP